VPRGDGQYGEAGERMILDTRISRRRFLQMGAGAAAGALLLPVLPETARAGTLVDPYSGSIPLVFPLVYGTYKTPLCRITGTLTERGKSTPGTTGTAHRNAHTTGWMSILPGAVNCPGSMRRSQARSRRSAYALPTRSMRP
jgi:hypothetical protein